MDDKVDIERHLSKKDPDLGRVIEIVRAARGISLRRPPSTDNPFQSLVRAVIYQRVSEASGSTVYTRLEEIAGGKLKPAKILTLTVGRIQKAGLARSKAAYITNLAEWFDPKPRAAKKLPAMSDDEVIGALTAISGIGLWTVNVFLVFNLGRLDVAPAPDTVIRGIAQTVYGLLTLPSVNFVEKKMELWRPYRSIASMYLYKATKLKVTAADIRRGHLKIDQAGIRSGT
jgi:DNA-3-methyladenine glycosylase II